MNDVYKQHEVLQWAFSFLKEHGREEAVAEILLQHHLNVSRSKFYTTMHEPIRKEIVDIFKRDIMKHAKTGVPVQHLTGIAHFYSRSFQVNENVLIPRFETEELVHHVIHFVQKEYKDEPVTIVDVGTGSGVIAITLALELFNVKVYATDISKAALQVAKTNAQMHDANVQFLYGDFLQPMIEQNIIPQIIVSNPPYINKKDEALLSDTVIEFDPHLALFAENEGLKAYEEITSQLTSVIDEKANVFFEIGYDQAEAVTSIVKKRFPYSDVKTIKDINHKDRIISAEITQK